MNVRWLNELDTVMHTERVTPLHGQRALHAGREFREGLIDSLAATGDKILNDVTQPHP